VASGHQGTGGTETLIPAFACNITCKESPSVCGEWPDFNDKAKIKTSIPLFAPPKPDFVKRLEIMETVFLVS
jgi:hypothetical protein